MTTETDVPEVPEFDKVAAQAEAAEKFKSLHERVLAVRAISTPLREKRDAIVRDHRAEEEKLNAEIALAEKGLFAMEQERAHHARAMRGTISLQAETGVLPRAEAADPTAS